MFCEHGPICYAISLRKEILKRHIKNHFSRDKIAFNKSDIELPVLVKAHTSIIVRELDGVDISLQKSKVKNIELASASINKLVIKPNEVFSFWSTVKKPTKAKGYQDGLVIYINKLGKGIGGGLCQMANMVHWLVLHSPLEVVEFYHHTDSLFPDNKRKVPFGTGTSVSYNNLDYRFKNTTDQDVQLLTWCEDGFLCGELRTTKPFKNKYEIVEENSHYRKENEIFYRISKVYKLTIDAKTNRVIEKNLILDNHSRVLYDYSKIPKNEIRDY